MEEHRHRILMVAVFLALAAATVLLGVAYSRYRSVGPELLVNGDFSRGLDHWRIQGPPAAVSLTREEPPTVRLHSADPDRYTGIVQSIRDPGRFKLLELSGMIRTKAVAAGKEAWHKARLILSSFDEKGRWIPGAHLVVALVGDHPWKRYAEVFQVIPEAEELRVSIQLAQATGIVWARDLSLREAMQRPLYVFVQTGVFGLWGLFIACLMVPLVLGCPRNLLRLALTASILLVLSGTLLPGPYRRVVERDMTDAYVAAIAHREPGAADTQQPAQGRSHRIKVWEGIRNIAKAGHFVLYGLLAFSLAAAFPARAWGILMLELGMMGGGTEMLQFFIEGRTPLVGDWLLDLAGATAALGLVALWRKRHIANLVKVRVP